MKHRHLSLRLGVLLFSLASTGCNTIQTSEANGDLSQLLGKTGVAGNFYFLPKAKLRITGNYASGTKDFVIRVERRLEPDSSRRLFAAYRSNPLADDTVRFVVNSRGLLDGMFTTMSEDRTGAVLESLATSAINVWKISSYGAVGPGQTNLTPGGDTKGLRSGAEIRPLKPFDVVFDPYGRDAREAMTVGDFSVKVNAIAGEPVSSAVVPVNPATNQKAKAGLVFRAPSVIELVIRRKGVVPKEDKTTKTTQADQGGGGPAPQNGGTTHLVPPVGQPTPGAEAAAPDPAKAATPALTANKATDLGVPSDFAFTTEQLSSEIIAYTLHEANTTTSCNLAMNVKTPDPRAGAEVPFSFRRAALVKKTTALGFSNGELMGVDIRKPSELLAFVKIPEKITTDLLAAIPAVIQIRDGRAQREYSGTLQPDLQAAQRLKTETALISAETALLQARKAQLDAQKALDAAEKKTP